MGTCPTLPGKTVREILDRTAETGNEHGAVVCNDGSVTKVVEGGKSGMNIGKAIRECGGDGPYTLIHSHPNGAATLSGQDRKVAADDDIESVCAVVKGGTVHCESIDVCDTEIDQ